MDRVVVIVQSGNDPGCHDVELHARHDSSLGDGEVCIYCVASYGTADEAEEHAERIRRALQAK